MTRVQKMNVVFIPLLLAGMTLPAMAGERSSDSTINFWVKEALRADPRVDSSHVVAKTNDGIVTLSGEVRDLASKKYAVLETRKVDGARGVVDELEVKPVRRLDNEMATDIRWRLTNSASLRPRDLSVEVIDGNATLRGTVDTWTEHEEAGLLASEVRGVRQVRNELRVDCRNNRPDDVIQEDVVATINRDAYLVGLPIVVTVEDGMVTLTGSVGSAFERGRARNDARWVGNVKGVKDDLKVEWWENRGARKKFPMPSDAELQKAVRSELYQDLRIEDPFEVRVECKLGHATLRGTVPSYHERRLAGQDAHDVVGVGWVTNNLVVKPARRDDLAVRKDVESRFDSDYLLNGQDIDVQVSGGIVTLTGNTNSYDERSHAVEVASRVPGVIDVQDKLSVNWLFRYTDDKLKEHIKDRLAHHAQTRWASGRINVEVNDAVATLTGDVPDWVVRREAGRIAFLTDGIRGVVIRLTVEGMSYPWNEWHSPMAEDWAYEFYFDPYLE